MSVLCVDVGGTYIKSGAIDEALNLSGFAKTPTPLESMESFLRAIKQIFDGYHGVSGVAMSMPGILDEKTGLMRTGGALRFIKNFDMRTRLSELFGGLPVTIDNDAKAAARAELISGALKNYEDGIVVLYGTGIGGAVIVGRKILRGVNLFAGEFSYMRAGARVGTGDFSEGSWARKTNGGSVAERYQNAKGMNGGDLRSEDVFALAETGDVAAKSVIDGFCADIAEFLFNLQCVTDPQVIAVGGGISEQATLIPIIRLKVEELRTKLPVWAPELNIVSCHYRGDANLIGAYYHFMEVYDGIS